MCQVLFASSEITNKMAPPHTVENIQHLFISTSDKDVSDHQSLLAAYTEVDKYLAEKDVQRPVVLLPDGHSSRFGYEVLSFLHLRNFRLFLTTAFARSTKQKPVP